MRDYKFFLTGWILAAIILNWVDISGQEYSGDTVSLNPGDTLPFDQGVLKGKLANGLTYYLRENEKPENRAQVWLAVNAGSVLEDEDQLGLAHFLEHL